MKKTLTTIMVFGLIITQAQNVGINTDAPKAALDVAARLAGAEAITAVDGIIPATMTGNQLAAKTGYGTDQEGAMVYITQAATAQGSTPIPARATNLTAPGLYTWDGSAWQKVGKGEKNNLYTTDGILNGDRIVNMGNHSLRFSNDIKIGKGNHAITIGKGTTTRTDEYQYSNTALGRDALQNNTTGHSNTASGNWALRSNTTGDGNTASGFQALYSNTEGYYNTAIGSIALQNNTTGHSNTASGNWALRNNTTGIYNTASGFQALYSNTKGYRNTANGNLALRYNTTGRYNTACGNEALRSNTEGDSNTASGNEALRSNTIGDSNTASGNEALYSNTTGRYNTASGYQALVSNTSGYSNTVSGYATLRENTTGSFNTAMGYHAMRQLKGLSYYNTAIGYDALYDQTAGDNNIGVGANATVPNKTGSNQIRIGSYRMDYAGIGIAWTITSDRRFKGAIRDIAKTSALSLISKLRPVEYARREVDYHKEKKAGVSPFTISNRLDSKTEFGFIAQEVEEALQSSGYSSSGIITVGDDGYYGVRYNDFIPILTKAIQEQQTQLEAQNKKLDAQQQEVNELKILVKQLINQKK